MREPNNAVRGKGRLALLPLSLAVPACLALGALLASAPRAVAQDTGVSFAEFRVQMSIDKGQEWLVGQQSHDGSWPCEVGGPPDIGTTAVCLLALMADGNTRRSGRYRKHVERGIEWIRREVKRRGPGKLSGGSSTLQSELGDKIHTFFATLLLAEISGMEVTRTQASQRRDRDMRNLLRRGAEYIEGIQATDGSWRTSGRAPIFSTTTAFLALRSARATGVAVQRASLGKLLSYVRSIYVHEQGVFQSGQSAGIPLYDNCNALRILYGLGEHQNEMGRAATKRLFDLVRTRFTVGQIGGEELLCWWYVTSTLIHDGGPTFYRWYDLVTDKLMAIQNADGSWTGHGCINGRVFCTAAALMTLEAPRRYLPMDSL